MDFYREETTEYSVNNFQEAKECVVCGAEIDEQHESILFECERCMNLHAE
ncbi:YhfH family protein [Alicyclobacillus cycloheptanicus]|uniref:RNA-binding Zn-ribbon protein involved in translation (DUF1610 family) n=1 Tax=Alicyclobacillus cycloheptanicus TaxID=1457 RepID=A0ABT9XE98_9BACL|nr:protein YhfH [Alicyclobacillus cycloheptanicus]MDQ0188507.1 putative RNA-binding Zn-ribbon protein involved in translation (DUF1610 family) [Alicyclobacillus cycloheptanicus]WDM01194.1 YhfH family protein [Alicyclobacillus cycloheptanicus]